MSRASYPHQVQLAIWCQWSQTIWKVEGTYFPSCCSTLKIPERLRQLQRLHHNPLLLLIVSDLSVSSQREVLSQRMPIKAVVGHNSSKIWVTNKEDAEHIINLPLVPVRPVIKICNAGDRGCLVCVSLDSNSGVVADAQKVVNNFKSLVSSGEIDSGNIGYLGELSSGIICYYQLLIPWQKINETVHLRNEKTGVTPAGEM